jgi:hypothetical protein
MEYRKNEPVRTWFRSHRIFRSNEYWYFHTREGIDVGPFQSEFEAQVESNILKHVLNGTADDKDAIAAIREFLLDAPTATMNLRGLTNYVEKDGRF